MAASRSEKIAAERAREEEKKKSVARDVAEATPEIRWLTESGFLDHGPVWASMWYQLGLRRCDDETPNVTLPEANLEEFVKRARENAEAFELAKFFVSLRLARNLAVPPGISSLIAEYLNGEFIPESAGRGRKTTTWGRDFIFARTFQMLENRWEHRRPYRRKGSTSSSRSISEIVHLALRETRIGFIDVDRIQRIRRELKDSKAHEYTLTMMIVWEFDDYEDSENGKEPIPARRV